MATGSQIIAKARQFIGYGASTFTNWYGVSSSTAWCSIFVSYIMSACGISYPKVAYVPTAQQYCANHGTMVKMANAQAGDIVIFTWSGGGNNTGTGSRDHIGFIIKNNGNGTFTTIEGNTSGGRVAIRVRAAKYIYGIYRLNNMSGGGGGSTPSTPTGGGGSTGLYYINTPDGLNVRSGAGTNYSILRAYPQGTPIRVLKVENGFGYSSGAGGWLCMDYLSTSGGGSSASAPSVSAPSYSVGRTYTIVEPSGLKVRTGAGTGYRWKKRSELTTDGRRHSASGTYAVLVKGTQVTCQAVSGNWLRIPSGWICGREGSRVYVK